MPLCQSEQVLQGEQQRSTAAANKTLLGAGMHRRRMQEKRKEGLISGRTAGVEQDTVSRGGKVIRRCRRRRAGSAKLQSKKAVLAGSRPDPKTASKKRFSI